MQHLIEFPDDELAFDFREVTKIRSKKQKVSLPTCEGKCPDSDTHVGVGFKYILCNNSKHQNTFNPTIITIGGEDHEILRPFHDVMLVISAQLQQTPTQPDDPRFRKHDFGKGNWPDLPPMSGDLNLSDDDW